jgi:hypothetical protein
MEKITSKIPTTAVNTPMTPVRVIFSLKNIGATMQLESSANTPSGLTIDAGANPYARKLPISPVLIVSTELSIGQLINGPDN